MPPPLYQPSPSPPYFNPALLPELPSVPNPGLWLSDRRADDSSNPGSATRSVDQIPSSGCSHQHQPEPRLALCLWSCALGSTPSRALTHGFENLFNRSQSPTPRTRLPPEHPQVGCGRLGSNPAPLETTPVCCGGIENVPPPSPRADR